MSKPNIIIMGSQGMLGQMVKRYFSGNKIHLFDDKITAENIFDIVQQINSLEDGFVINCIGKIKQKTEDPFALLWSNTILPLELNRSLKKSHFLIQPSTDCVFSGNTEAPYANGFPNDATDLYGWSKSLGEIALQSRINTLIIRVSIIGPDNNSNKGLLSWFLSLPENASVNGFNNHYWNGITTLEWCKFVYEYIHNNNKPRSILNTIQLGTNSKYSKFEMLIMFKKVFEKQVNIVKYNTEVAVNKVLVPDVAQQDLEAQLEELKIYLNN